jgi:hypothetical protein
VLGRVRGKRWRAAAIEAGASNSSSSSRSSRNSRNSRNRVQGAEAFDASDAAAALQVKLKWPLQQFACS